MDGKAPSQVLWLLLLWPPGKFERSVGIAEASIDSNALHLMEVLINIITSMNIWFYVFNVRYEMCHPDDPFSIISICISRSYKVTMGYQTGQDINNALFSYQGNQGNMLNS